MLHFMRCVIHSHRVNTKKNVRRKPKRPTREKTTPDDIREVNREGNDQDVIMIIIMLIM